MDYSNYNVNKDELICSWPVILIALYFCFPIGIYLIIRKSKLHRRNVFTIGKKTFLSAISLLIFGGMFYIPKIASFSINIFGSPNNPDLEMIINSKFYAGALNFGNFFIVVGIAVLFISLYQRNKSKKYQKYIYLIVNKEIENLNDISDEMKTSKNVVIKDINKMINNKFLEKFSLDIENNKIYNLDKEKAKKEAKSKFSRVVRCPNCHADNFIEDKIGKCAYCKSYIE